MANALALSFARTFPEFGEEASALILGIIAVNVLVAPALMRLSFVRAGESTAVTSANGTDPGGALPLAPAEEAGPASPG